MSSTLLGARTVAHLEANIKALDIELGVQDIEPLDGLSMPPVTFVIKLAGLADVVVNHSMTINCQASPAWWGAPPSEAARY